MAERPSVNGRGNKVPHPLGGLAGRWKDNRAIQHEVAWSDVDAGKLRAMVDSVTRAGGAVMLGRTSDAGAYSICILMDADRLKEYPHTTEEANDLLQEIMEGFVGL